MGFDKKRLEDYNTVAERMTEFFCKYPEGSFQSECQLLEVNGRWAAIVKAFAYRSPQDPRPGVGLAFEFIPGKTPYTEDSELQNAETAAWGRAIVAVGAADTRKGIASREEVQARQVPTAKAANSHGQDALIRVINKKGLDPNAVAKSFQERFGRHPREAGNDELMAFAMLLDEDALGQVGV